MCFGIGSPVLADTKAKDLFGNKIQGSQQRSAAYGSYAKGCVAGAKQLAETGPTWQAMRLSRNRNWGHPVLISYIKEISRKVSKLPNWKGLYIGDISQPRGGPMISGHMSHQMGLDVDIWMYPPKRLNLTKAEREKVSSISVRTKDQKHINKNWTASHMQVLKIAASDPKVDRIFVTPPVKIWMCKNARGNKNWLQKIRPFWGHNYHFHVRLKCPAGSSGCKKQTPTVAALSKGGNGCDNLRWWVTAALKPAKSQPKATKKKATKKKVPKKRHPRDYTMRDLPSQCLNVLRSK